MGLGPGPQEKRDLMETSIRPNPQNNSVKFRNKVFELVLRHRDIFGYSKSSGKVPYMFVTNDLAGIFVEFMQMLQMHRQNEVIMPLAGELTDIVTLLILSYDDVKDPNNRLWHSVEKSVFVEMKRTLEAGG